MIIILLIIINNLISLIFYSGNGRYASWGTMVGFIIMMSLDVALG